MRVRCVSEYRGTVNHLTDEEGRVAAGDVLHVDDAVGEFLLRASPGSFEALAEPEGDGGDVVAEAPTKIAKGGRSR
jgi:hypothetical protein